MNGPNTEGDALNKARKKHLETKGWKIGTAQDILKLSAEEVRQMAIRPVSKPRQDWEKKFKAMAKKGEKEIWPEYDFSNGVRGKHALDSLPKGKTRILFRIDKDILAWFERTVESQGGGDYQALMNQALRLHMKERMVARFDSLAAKVRSQARRAGIKPADITEAIKKVRARTRAK